MAGRAVTASLDPRAPAGGGKGTPGARVGPRLRSRLTLPGRTTPRTRRPTPTAPTRPGPAAPGAGPGGGGRRAACSGGMGRSAPPASARPQLTQRAAMRALHHPRQNNSDRHSLPSPAELCACKGPVWATKILVERPGGCALGIGNSKRTGGWNPSPGARGPGRAASVRRAGVLDSRKPFCASLTVAFPAGLKHQP